MLENYEISKKIIEFNTRYSELATSIDLDKLNKEIEELEQEMNDPNIWSNQEKSSRVLKKIKEVKDKIKSMNDIKTSIDDLTFYFDMKKNGEMVDDEISSLIDSLENDLSNFEVRMLLSKEFDDCDAIIDMHPGAGGTESQDWCSMLFRMYTRFAERSGYDVEVLDYLDGEEAGIKSVSFMIKGDHAYGRLRGEQGVHRLVRISPFDAGARRHTSFCAVSVTPNVDRDINIEIKPNDIRVDTYKSSGAGGQYINKTESAIRITHLKTGIVVTCQTQRNQIQNREVAMRILKAKLYQLEQEEQMKKMKELSGEVSANSFGSQIRSYVFHPYSLVKDHRTNYESFNTNAVMDGDIDGFINAYLKSPYNK